MPDDGAMKDIERTTRENPVYRKPYREPLQKRDANFYGDNPDEDDYFEG